MKKNGIIIFGNNQFATMLCEYIKRYTDNHICCFTVNKKYIKENKILDLPVVAFEEIEDKYPSSNYKFLIALGYKDMNSLREKVFNQIHEKGYDIINFIHPSASINAKNMGIGNIFLDNVFIGLNSKIGNGNIFWNGVNISHDANIGNYNYFSPSTTIAGNVNINNNCFLGTNCTIKNGLTISNKTLIGAGCFLKNNTLDNEVYVPAKSIKLDKTSNEIKL